MIRCSEVSARWAAEANRSVRPIGDSSPNARCQSSGPARPSSPRLGNRKKSRATSSSESSGCGSESQSRPRRSAVRWRGLAEYSPAMTKTRRCMCIDSIAKRAGDLQYRHAILATCLVAAPHIVFTLSNDAVIDPVKVSVGLIGPARTAICRKGTPGADTTGCDAATGSKVAGGRSSSWKLTLCDEGFHQSRSVCGLPSVTEPSVVGGWMGVKLEQFAVSHRITREETLVAFMLIDAKTSPTWLPGRLMSGAVPEPFEPSL